MKIAGTYLLQGPFGPNKTNLPTTYLSGRGQPVGLRSYFATTLRRAWGVHFAREFARHRIRRVVFVGAPRRQPGRPLATADGDWPALSAGEFAAHALRVGGAWAGGPPGRR